MSHFELIATATFGLEAVVAGELKALGYDSLKIENGRVSFAADESAICRCNLWLRCAERLRLKVGEFQALTFDELFEKTKALPWADLMPSNAFFPVDGKSIQSSLFSISDCQAIVKKAVVESLKKKYRRDWFSEEGPLYRIEISLLKDIATLTIDTSGAGLHKRGYRKGGSEAPLKETLAAALVLLTRWKPDTALIDPFCGSGTILIEAALIGHNIAPGMNRTFASEEWPTIDRKYWREARKETHERAENDINLDLTGTDLNDNAIQTARKNAAEAGVEELIHFQTRSLSELSSKKKYGKIICNPPYGERLSDAKEIKKLYRAMGQVFGTLETWSYYILTADENFESIFGRKASKKRKLYHGNIKVQYYQYYGPRPPRN